MAGARQYKRDANGRFAGGGGGGGGRKSASTRAANSARAAGLKAKGTTAIGGRVKAKGFAGGKGAQERAGGLRRGGTTSLKRGASTAGAGTRSMMKANAAQVRKKSKKVGTVNKAARMSKSPVSEAKARYKELSSTARKSSPNRTAAENRAAAGARRSMKAMEAKRGRAAAPKKRPILDAIARPILRAMEGGGKKRSRR